MQIKIEIDVKPEELRRFLGLPDVVGLQEDVVRFLRDKVGAAGESLDANAMVQSSVDLIKRTPAWRLLRTAMLGKDGIAEEATLVDEMTSAVKMPEPKPTTRRGAPKKRPRKRAPSV
jgi:hypothetical protein